MPPIRLLMISLAALLGAASCRTFVTPETKIQQGIAAAIQASSFSDYTKNGCLASLQLWADEKTPPKLDADNPSSALFFLGDSYLTYNFAFVGVEHKQPTLIRHVAEGPDQAFLSHEELSELTSLVSNSKSDGPPREGSKANHRVCSVFYTPTDGYFVVLPEEQQDSQRSTDLAIRFVSQISPDAP